MNHNPDHKQLHLGLKPFSIWKYLLLMNLVLLCLLFPSITMIFLNEDTKFRDFHLERTLTQMRAGLESKSASLARVLSLSAGQAISGYDYTALNIMLSEVVSDDPDFLYALIMSPDRKVMVHSNPDRIGSTLNSPADLKAAKLVRRKFPARGKDNRPAKTVLFMDRELDTGSGPEPVMEVIVPVYNGNVFWGALRCGYSLKSLHREMRLTENEWAGKMAQFKKYSLTMTAIFFAIGILAATLFTRPLGRAVQLLRDGVSRVSRGDLDYAIVQEGFACVEFLELTTAFNNMTLKLKESYRQLGEHSKSLEQKVVERTRELEQAQANLMQQAHEAGMAEMAVGILHNIGNAITPAKVAAAMMLKRLRNNPVPAGLEQPLARIHTVVEQAPGLAGQEKEKLLKILELLPETLRNDYDMMYNNIKKIETKHEHIEGIIRLQMRYAHLFDDFEEVDVNRVVEDALSILAESLRKRAIVVKTTLSDVPPVQFGKAKLIQIVVNLLKNAFEAMDGNEDRERALTITTFREAGPPVFVVLSIRDTGIGFSPEEKERLFQFGYTTKTGGSGFGLHSCANYLVANRGSIAAHSDGRGKGAEFVVRLAVGDQRQIQAGLENIGT